MEKLLNEKIEIEMKIKEDALKSSPLKKNYTDILKRFNEKAKNVVMYQDLLELKAETDKDIRYLTHEARTNYDKETLLVASLNAVTELFKEFQANLEAKVS